MWHKQLKIPLGFLLVLLQYDLLQIHSNPFTVNGSPQPKGFNISGIHCKRVGAYMQKLDQIDGLLFLEVIRK